MRLTRNPRERLVDALLSLVLLNFCAPHPEGVVGDRLKVAKLLFLATHELLAKQAKALSFSFYRYYHGPFTTELYETWGELSWIGFLDVPPGATGKIVLTDSGVEAAKRYERRLADLGNGWALQSFRHIADTYCQLHTSELLRRVYTMEVRPLGWNQHISISDAPMGTYFTCALDSDEARQAVAIDDALASEFFNDLTREYRPRHASDAEYREIYTSTIRGVRAERAGLPATEVSWSELERKLKGGE